MATKPSSTPEWASDETNNTEPGSTQKGTGWTTNQVGVSAYMNWWQKLVYDWTLWLDAFESEAHTWSAAQTFANIAASTVQGLLSFSGPAGDTSTHLEFNVQPTDRKRILHTRASNGSPAVYDRIYSTADKAIEITCNARWDGTQWVPDSTSFASSKLRITTAGMAYSSAVAGPGTFSDAALGAVKFSCVPGDFTKGQIMGVSATGEMKTLGPATGAYAYEDLVAISTINAGWTASPFEDPMVYRDGVGRGHLEGGVVYGGGGGGAGAAAAAFTIQSGYRPAKGLQVLIPVFDAGGGTWRAVRASIGSNGDCSPVMTGSVTGEVFYFDNVSYRL